MATEVTQEQLLAAILESQNRCNSLLGAVFREVRNDALAKVNQQGSLDRWKASNRKLSQRCGRAAEVLNTIFESYLICMLDHIDEMDDPGNEFQVREFLDKYGQGFLQLNGLIQTVGQLSS